MAQQESDMRQEKEQSYQNLQIRQMIQDLIVYAMPIIEKWKIAHQKLLGDDIAHCMNEMLELAVALEVEYSKKTPCKNLDVKNQALQDYITLAFKLKYLKGSTSHAEWTRRSKEIGAMIGSYKKWIYEEVTAIEKKESATKRQYNGNCGNRYKGTNR